MTWQNQQSDCAPSEDSDQPGHPPSLIRVLLSAWRNHGSLATHRAHSEDSDQTGRMPRLIWVFAGRTVTLLVLSCCGSYLNLRLSSVRDVAFSFSSHEQTQCYTVSCFWTVYCLCISNVSTFSAYQHQYLQPCGSMLTWKYFLSEWTASQKFTSVMMSSLNSAPLWVGHSTGPLKR